MVLHHKIYIQLIYFLYYRYEYQQKKDRVYEYICIKAKECHY